MTGRAPGRPPPGGLLSRGGTEPLPVRPLLTTPPHLQHQAFADLQRQRLAAQPWLGVGGMLLGAAVFFALAAGTGSTQTSLLILGPISTFALPAVAMVAFWWNDWPGSRLTTPWTAPIDTALVAAAAVVLTIAGQAACRALGPSTVRRDVATGRKTATLAEGDTVNSIALSPDGRTLAVGDGAGHVGLWDMATGRKTAGDFVPVVAVSGGGVGRSTSRLAAGTVRDCDRRRGT